MRTRAENLWILRNASGQTAQENPVQQNNIIRSRDESLRILQTFPVILNREAVKNPVNRSAENYGTLSPGDVGATFAVARPNGSPTVGAGVSPSTETKPMGSGGGGFSGGGGGRSGRAADNSGSSTASGSFAQPRSQNSGDGTTADSGGFSGTSGSFVKSEAEIELERLKPVLEEASRLDAELGRYVSGATRDPALYTSTLIQRDRLLKKYGYSSVDELNKVVIDYTIASGNELSLMQKLDKAGYAMEEGLKNTVFSGEWWKNIASGGAKLWSGNKVNAAGTVAGNVESIGKESARMVYENELRARNDWATTLEEAKTGVIKMDAEGIAEIEKILDYYDNTLMPSLRSGVQAYETLAEASAQAADEITLSGQEDVKRAKENLGVGGKFATDVAVGAVQQVLDKATTVPTLSLATGAFGSGAQKARQEGYSAQEQMSYGTAVAAKEWITEKLSGFGSVYGKGSLDDVVDSAIEKLAKSEAGRSVLRIISGTLGEWTESLLSNAVDPALEGLILSKTGPFGEYRKLTKEDLSQWLYDALVEAALGTVISGLKELRPTPVGEKVNADAKTQEPTQAQAQGMTAALQDQAPQPGTEQKNSAPEEAESTAVNTDPAQHTAVEQAVIDEYQAAVDNRLLAFIEKWRTLKNPDYKKRIQIPIAEITERATGEIQRLIGVDVTDYKHMLSGNALEHIEIRHGKNGEADHSLSDPNDIARMGYVLENYDVIEPVLDSQGRQKRSTQYSNADNTMAPLISFKKSVNGTYYVVEAVPDSAAKQLRVVSAYMQKKSGSTDQVLNMANAPQLTPKVPHGANTPASTPPVNAEALRVTSKNAALMPDNSIQQSGENYNKDSQSALETGNTTAKTDPAAAARQQQYQTEITAALRAGDYQLALKRFKEFGNPNLRALNDFQTLKAFGDYAAAMGYDVSPEDISTDETLAAFEESFQNAIENAVEGSIITSGADVVKDAIKAGSVSTTINSEKQARHIFGSDGYIAGRSYINGTLEDAQMLVDALSGTGTPIFDKNGNWTNKERVQCKNVIGIHVDQDTKNENETKKATIIYSKTGSHIVPRKGDDK